MTAIHGTMHRGANVSIISLYQQDYSDSLCGRFASLISQYLDQPEEARKPGAVIPLENLFRVLQMCRYEAFSDERRSGVLALEGLDTSSSLTADDENWYVRIQTAVSNALSASFHDIPKEEAIPQIQSALRWLATDREAPSSEIRSRAKAFLNRLSADLR